MRDFYFFTSKPITIEDCFDALKSEIPHIEKYGETDIWINAKSRSFLLFSSDSINDFIFDTPEEFETFKSKIPIQNPCITDFETHRSIDAKRVVSVLMKLYPDLYINVNDSSNWFGTAQEYLDTEFDY